MRYTRGFPRVIIPRLHLYDEKKGPHWLPFDNVDQLTLAVRWIVVATSEKLAALLHRVVDVRKREFLRWYVQRHCVHAACAGGDTEVRRRGEYRGWVTARDSSLLACRVRRVIDSFWMIKENAAKSCSTVYILFILFTLSLSWCTENNRIFDGLIKSLLWGKECIYIGRLSILYTHQRKMTLTF